MSNSAALLNTNLAAAMDLHARLKHAHWNVTGPVFIAVHELFDKMAEQAEDWADMMGEQIRFLDFEAYGTALSASKSFLGPYSVGIASAESHISAILASMTLFSSSTKAAASSCLKANDQVTANIFVTITGESQKNIYFLRSFKGMIPNG